MCEVARVSCRVKLSSGRNLAQAVIGNALTCFTIPVSSAMVLRLANAGPDLVDGFGSARHRPERTRKERGAVFSPGRVLGIDGDKPRKPLASRCIRFLRCLKLLLVELDQLAQLILRDQIRLKAGRLRTRGAFSRHQRQSGMPIPLVAEWHAPAHVALTRVVVVLAVPKGPDCPSTNNVKIQDYSPSAICASRGGGLGHPLAVRMRSSVSPCPWARPCFSPQRYRLLTLVGDNQKNT